MRMTVPPQASPRRASRRTTATGRIATLPAVVSAWFAAHPARVIAAAAGLVVIALGAGAVVAGSASGSPAAMTLAAVEAAARSVPEAGAAPARVRSCGLDTSDPALATLGASVINVGTGEHLYSLDAELGAPTAGVHKLITAAAALQVLGPDTRLATRVFEGSVPGTIVLVGGGDATLSALPAGTESVYPGAPKLADLAAQARASLDRLYPPKRDNGRDDRSAAPVDPADPESLLPPPAPALTPGYEITEIIVDSSLWGFGDKWDAGWASTERTTGTQSEITPLMVDGDRADATLATSPRGTDPVGRAATAFASALALASVPTISSGVAVSSAPPLAEVYSQPVSVLVAQMVHSNDNTLADMLARLVSKGVGSDGSSASLEQVYRSVLTNYGLTTDGVTVKDGSGLNGATMAPPVFVSSLLAVVATGGQGLQPVKDSLPVAGQTGTLASRFSGELSSVALTGTGGAGAAASTLAGIVTAADGSLLAVSLQSSGEVSPATGVALDVLAADIHACGDNLADVPRRP